MSKPFFSLEYQDLQDRAVECIGRNLTSEEIERSKWILFAISSDMLDKVLDKLIAEKGDNNER